MKRPLKIFLLTATLLAALLILLFWAGWLQVYTVPTMANYPALKQGSRVIASNFTQPKRGDLILYISRYDGDPGRPPGATFVHRLVARPGDVLDIRQGDLYINGKSVDSGRNLLHRYTLTEPKAAPYLAALPEEYEANVRHFDGGLVELPIETARASVVGLFANRAYQQPDFFDEYISRVWQQPWNRDNFGPFTMPTGKLFVLGDNRENSFDSRYAGFVEVKDVVGVVL